MTDSPRHSGLGEQENHRSSTQTDDRRSDSAGEQQAVEVGMGSTPMGATGSAKPRKGRYHLPPDETTHSHHRRAEPVIRPQHGENRRNSHFRKDVGPVKFNDIDDRHPESFAELDGLSTSPCHHSSGHFQSLRPEETNHPFA